MKREHKPKIMFPFLMRLLSLLGIVGLLGVPSQANASIDRERKALETRVCEVRKVINKIGDDSRIENRTVSSGDKVAQYWRNWGNWRNWRNW